MQRSEDRCDKRRFRGFNHSTCKTVLNQLEAVNLRFRKIVVERVTVVKFRVDNRGSIKHLHSFIHALTTNGVMRHLPCGSRVGFRPESLIWTNFSGLIDFENENPIRF